MISKLKEIFNFLILSFKSLFLDILAFVEISFKDIIAIFNSSFAIIFFIYFLILLFFPILNILVFIVLIAFSIYLFRFILPKINEVIQYFINPSITEDEDSIYQDFLEKFKEIKKIQDINNLNLNLNKSNKLQILLNDFFKSFNFKEFFSYIFLSLNMIIVFNIFIIVILFFVFIFTKFYDLKIINLITFKTVKFGILDYLFIIVFSLLFIIQIIWYFLFPVIILKAIESNKIGEFYYNVLYIFDDLNDNNTLMFFKNLFVDIFWDLFVLSIFYLPFIILNLFLIKVIMTNFIFFFLLNWIVLSFFIAIFLTLFFIRFTKNYYLYFCYL
jgi:hypothetical protein